MLEQKVIFIGIRRGGSSIAFMLLQRMFLHSGNKSQDIVRKMHDDCVHIHDIPLEIIIKSLECNDLVGCFRDIPDSFLQMNCDSIKFIVVMRDPRESFLSWFHASSLHADGPFPPTCFDNLQDYVASDDELIGVLDRVHAFIENKDHLILQYADLVFRPAEFIQNLISYTGIEPIRKGLDEVLVMANSVQLWANAGAHNRDGMPGRALLELEQPVLDMLNERYGHYIEKYNYSAVPSRSDWEAQAASRREIDSIKRFILDLANENALRMVEISRLNSIIEKLRSVLI